MASNNYSYNTHHAYNNECIDPSAVEIPLSRVKPLIKVLMAQGNSFNTILHGTEINIQDFSHLEKIISFQQYKRLVTNATDLSSDPAFALHLGEQSFFHHDSLIGSRIVSCPNVKESMILLTRYQPLFTQILAIDFELNQGGGVLHLEPHFPLGNALPFFIEFTCAMIYSQGRYCLGGLPIDASIELSYSRPSTQNMYEDFFSFPVHFNCSGNRVILSKKVLNQPSVFYNKIFAQQVDKACLVRVSELKSETKVLERVKNILKFQDLSKISLECLAETLCLSSRTLRRQLHAQNTSYKVLLENARKQKAFSLVNKLDLSIETLAEQLGYADSSSFSRAFKRWYKVSPKSYRESSRGESNAK